MGTTVPTRTRAPLDYSRLMYELQSAWDEIDKLKKNESELQDELQSTWDEIDKLKNETL